ncbi:hypothetical protein DRW42_25025 [Pedobacter miscanthi]|uniref:Uncharacterized protein n=1 Tax=Pedobacter miscanthi TaxID=2259170 RepID=A0A366KMP0_9SPHI|nr:hypothetical protein DRW42_25025 [Pedobacter miscanthi]
MQLLEGSFFPRDSSSPFEGGRGMQFGKRDESCGNSKQFSNRTIVIQLTLPLAKYFSRVVNFCAIRLFKVDNSATPAITRPPLKGAGGCN